MGKITGFLEIDRQEQKYAPAADRVRHYREFTIPMERQATEKQAARCMDCGIPFCHTGCPVNNQIPDWNDLVYNGRWREAARNLHSTNNFPEVTGRICPAPCEESCTLNLESVPVTIKAIEGAIADRAWEEGWVQPEVPAVKTGKRVAVVGSGPSGLAAAQQLARAGHDVHLFEKNAKAGGLMRYGIPDFKLEKHVLDRRVAQMEAEGVTFHYNVHIGFEKPLAELEEEFDAVLMAGGAENPRDLPVPGRELRGIHLAMHFLPQQNRRNSGEDLRNAEPILAKGKHVVVIGGGDTGSDCIGTSYRQGALSVTQLEILPLPPERENKMLVWPNWPLKLRVSTSQAEGAKRDFSVMTKNFEGKDGKVTALNCVRVDDRFKEIEGSDFQLPADLVLLAMGFLGPVKEGMVEESGVELDPRTNVKANIIDYKTTKPKIFSAGDMRRGQSLVVWAIREGRQAARAIDEFLMGESKLPR